MCRKPLNPSPAWFQVLNGLAPIRNKFNEKELYHVYHHHQAASSPTTTSTPWSWRAVPLTLEVGQAGRAGQRRRHGRLRRHHACCVCVTAAPRPRDGIDFFPLSVDFEEKLYSVGRIPGSFNRREGRPGEKGILTSRVIDRPIRPLFPSDFRNDVSVMCTVMSVDHDCSPEIAALIGTSAALAISDIPWNGPVGALKVGLVDGKLVLNPNSEQRKVSDLDVTVVSTGKKVVMIEAGANRGGQRHHVSRPSSWPIEENQKQVALINQMVAEIGKPKFDYPHADFNQELFDEIVATTSWTRPRPPWTPTTRTSVRPAGTRMIEHWHEKYLEEYPDMDQYLEEFTYKFQKKIVKAWLLEGHRVDGRAEERNPSPGRRGGRAAPGPRLRPVHPRPDAGAVRVHPGHPLRLPEAGYHLGGDGEAVYAPLQLPRLLRGRGQARPQPRPP